MTAKNEPNIATIWKWLEEVPDPEIPVLSVLDLGIVRDVLLSEDQIEVIITPTYSGCPAMDMIGVNLKAVLQAKSSKNIVISTIFTPAWTTDWITEEGKAKLKAYGIAPPVQETGDKYALFGKATQVDCPRCASSNTALLSQFGSTACKAMYQCLDCKEPFDYFKCH